MMGLEEIRNNLELINEIDWDMTPEEAVIRYLEWGNNWSHGNFVRSKNDVSYYFVIYTWRDPPTIFLIKRNSEEAVELAGFQMPEEIKDRFLESIAYNKGVYALDDDVRAWLEKELSV